VKRLNEIQPKVNDFNSRQRRGIKKPRIRDGGQ
jgi:hypothetical protein